jgi:ABC-2 type transport system permease protein
MIQVEWTRQVRRVRTWACIAALAGLPVVFTIAVYLDPPRRFRDINLFTFATSSGLNVAIAALLFMTQFFLIVVVAAFAGETVSGEASWGTLRYLLVRPVSRVRLVLAKMAVAYLLTIIAVLAIVLTGLLAGTIAFGWHNTFVLQRDQFPPVTIISPTEALGRLALGSAYVALMMLVVVAFGVLLSTITDSIAGAIVGTIVVVFASAVLTGLPGVDSIKPVLPTRYWDEWHQLFTGGSTSGMYQGVVSAAGWVVVVTAVALWRFQRKDILS